MSGTTTRRAFVGGGVALAVGAGVTKLPELVPRRQHALALDLVALSSAGPSPAFGTLRPTSSSNAQLSGKLLERGTSRVAGHLTITSIASDEGILRVHTLDLRDGTIVALGPDEKSVFPIASGTRAYAGARGRVTVRNAARAALALDVDFEL
jgi:hypothetical protein